MMSQSTWCWLVCPFSCPRLAPGPCHQPLLVGQRSTPLLSFGCFLFFHLYPWCSCFKISLEQNMKGVVISFLSPSLPCKLPPSPRPTTHMHTSANVCTHGHLRVPQDGSAGGRALLGWSEAGQPELGRNGRQLGKAGLIGSGP